MASVLLSASVERCFVSRMRDFCCTHCAAELDLWPRDTSWCSWIRQLENIKFIRSSISCFIGGDGNWQMGLISRKISRQLQEVLILQQQVAILGTIKLTLKIGTSIFQPRLLVQSESTLVRDYVVDVLSTLLMCLIYSVKHMQIW